MNHKRIGILAGMGPRSTSPFLDLVYDECQRQYGARYDSDYPEIVVFSWPAPFFIDRPVDDAALSDSIEEGLAALSETGVDVIAMPCNTAHKYFERLKKCTAAKLLNIIGITADRITDTAERITVLGTRQTLEMGLYQNAIRDRKKEFFFAADWQDTVDRIISEIKSGADPEFVAGEYVRFENELASTGVDTVLFACTDLAVIPESCRTLNVIDSSKALAEELVKEYLKKR